MFVLTKVRDVSENRIKGRKIEAFVLLLLLLFHHPVERRTATGGCHLYTILALASILPSAACSTLEILMRYINYSYKVPSQIE